MFGKPYVFLGAFALVAQLAAAQQIPACVLAAVNEFEDPSAVGSICGKPAKVDGLFSSLCGNNVAVAQSSFSNLCSSAGVVINFATVSPSASSSGTSGSSTASSSSSSSSGSASSTSSGSSSSSGSGSASSTGQTQSGSQTGSSSTAAHTGMTSSSGGSATSATGATASHTGAADRLMLAGYSLGAVAVAGLAVAL